MKNCMEIFKCYKDVREEKIQILDDQAHNEITVPILRKDNPQAINNNIKPKHQPKSSGFRIDTKRSGNQEEGEMPNVSFSITSSSNFSESLPSMSNKSIILKEQIKHHHKNNKSGHIESNVTFFGNAQEKSLSNESVKQLQFSYDDDMEETKYNTNNKKNSISESRDQIGPKVIIEQQKNEEKEAKSKRNNTHDTEKGILKKNNSKGIIFKDTNEESNLFPKAKTKRSEHKEEPANDNYPNSNNNININSKDNIITDITEPKKSPLPLRREVQFQPSKTDGKLLLNRVQSRSSFNYYNSMKLLVENNIGSFLLNKVLIDNKGIERGLRNKRDGYVHFGFDRMDSIGQTINDVLVNKQVIPNIDAGYKNRTLFSIYYDTNCQKFFFQPVKNKVKEIIKVYFNIILPYSFISNQTFEMNSAVVNLEPNLKDNTIGIRINQDNVIIMTKSKKVSFFSSNTSSNGIELKSPPVAGDVSSICMLHYEKGKELWTLIPQSINIWLNSLCKQSLEQSMLIKYSNESIIKVTPIT